MAAAVYGIPGIHIGIRWGWPRTTDGTPAQSVVVAILSFRGEANGKAWWLLVERRPASPSQRSKLLTNISSYASWYRFSDISAVIGSPLISVSRHRRISRYQFCRK